MKTSGVLDIFDRWGATAGLVVAAIAYCVFIDMPYSSETAQLRGDTATRREFIAESERLVRKTNAIESEGKEAIEYVSAWQTATPNSEDVGTFFGEIHHAVRRAGVTIARFEPQTPIPLSSIEQRPVALSLEGTHAQISAALVNIEKLPATIWVKDVVMTPVRETAGVVRFESKLVVFTDKAANSD